MIDDNHPTTHNYSRCSYCILGIVCSLMVKSVFWTEKWMTLPPWHSGPRTSPTEAPWPWHWRADLRGAKTMMTVHGWLVGHWKCLNHVETCGIVDPHDLRKMVDQPRKYRIQPSELRYKFHKWYMINNQWQSMGISGGLTLRNRGMRKLHC